MLIICNGTFKSGSSWMHAIIIEILKIKQIDTSEIPNIYNPNIKSPTRILENNLNQFIEQEDFFNLTFVTKSHYFKSKTLSFNYPNSVFFLFIVREPKDAIVSHYFHFRNYRFKTLSFSCYFWLIGVFKAYELYIFNKRCKEYFPHKNFFTFEGFKNNFSDNVKKLSNIIGVNHLSANDLETIKDNTTLKKMRKESILGNSKYYPELEADSYKLFRSGKIGEWKTIFSSRELSFIRKILEGNSPLFIRVGYFMFFTLRRKIGL